MMARFVLTIVVSALAAEILGLTGCSSDGNSTETEADRPVLSVEAVVRTLRDADIAVTVTGQVEEGQGLPVFTAIEGLPSTERQLGEFLVAVFETRSDALRAASTAGEAPALSGVRWQRQEPEPDSGLTPYWAAIAVYENVELIWFNERRALDRRWNKIAAALRRVVETR